MPEQYALFTKAINPASAKELIDFMVAQAAAKIDRLTLAISSAGGQVPSGIAVYNLMLAMPYEVVTHNVGNVDSITNVIFLGGRTRYTNAAGMFVFHGVGFDITQNVRLEEKYLSERLDSVLSDHKRMSAIINSRTGNKLSLEQGLELFKEQRARDATWAHANGLVSSIREFAVPAGVNVQLFT